MIKILMLISAVACNAPLATDMTRDCVEFTIGPVDVTEYMESKTNTTGLPAQEVCVAAGHGAARHAQDAGKVLVYTECFWSEVKGEPV